MIKAYFNYSGNRILILCSLDEKMRNICQKFAVKAQVNVDSKIYICENKTLSINPNLNLSFGEQINSKDTNDKEIMVLDDRDKEYTIQFIYNGEKKEIKVNEGENYQSILSQIGKMFNKGKIKLMSIYNGSIITDEDMEKPISQISKSIDREEKKISVTLMNKNNEVIKHFKEDDVHKLRDLCQPYISEVSHGLYLGSELQRAKNCLDSGENYIQD